MDEKRVPPPELHETPEDEASTDVWPDSPGRRKVAIAIYILIVFCVIAGLLLSMVWSGIFADRWSFPLPETWSV